MIQVNSLGKASTVKKTFSRETTISININANKSIIWALLTNAKDYPRWNSTILALEGNISKGVVFKLRSTLDPKREFNLKVKEYKEDSSLVWGDAMGTRVMTITSISENLNNFTMNEKIGGPIFPLFSRMIPTFDESFEKFANDLKNEAEIVSNLK